MDEKRLKYLESKIPKGLDIESKYFPKFEKYACYFGNGVYSWRGIVSNCPRELFLMGCLKIENIKFKER